MSKTSPADEIKSRIKARIDEASRHGGGAAFPANQQLLGKSPEEARKAARNVEKMLKGESPEEDETGREKEEEKEIPPPDKEDPTPAEETAANLLALVRGAAAKGKPKTEFEVQEEKLYEEALKQMRRDVESDLKKIDIQQLLFYNTVEQTVSIMGGEVTIHMRSLRTGDYAMIDRFVMTTPEFDGLGLHLRERFRQWCVICLTVVELNGTPFGQPLAVPKDDQNRFIVDHKTFKALYGEPLKERVAHLLELPPPLLDLLAHNVSWFEQRIRRVFMNGAYVGQEIKKS